MKVSLMAIAFFGSVSMLGQAVSAFHPPLPPSLHPTTISQATEQVDLALLAQMVTNLLKSDRYQTDSQIEFKVGSKGTERTIYLQSKMIMQSGRKFRAEITYNKPGKSPQPGNLVISDGKQVWIYRSDLKQYAVTSYFDFKDSNDWVLIGLSSFVFLDFPEEDRKVAANGNLSQRNVLTYLNVDGRTGFKGIRQKVDGQEVYVYNYKHPTDEFTLNAVVNPQTANLKQVQLIGKSKNLDIFVTERIVNKITNPIIRTGTFRFFPPKGTKRVKTLSIKPL
ncbi:unknown protein [Nostoc sp. NIES-3756]|uniref:LolA family protein n=1 Tax=Nostoc sp. NIES-3756 TaxID=1751286 RepID=UPI0007210AA7|nr:hypothetical protein [Nostoc sp. NIES-3756]BAT55235.1 unknown protein [Nostoc sp. NIES-3756]BAY36985.1 hypothetical protein NIES2111_13190 [Nostoc sp. NIES-2111]